MATRKFVCASCGYELEVPYGTGGAGSQMKCPQCGGIVHRVDPGGGRGRGPAGGGRGTGMGGRGPGVGGRGRGGAGRGPRF